MKIIYVYDALCGWCYGFSDVIKRFYEKYKENYDFEVVSGGMITGDRVGPVGEVAPYIKSAYKQVEERTGVRFGRAFLDEILEEGLAIFSSLEPADTLSVIKNHYPGLQLPFAHHLQKAIYFDGLAPTEKDKYRNLVESFDIPFESFLSKWDEPATRKRTFQDFQLAQELQVKGFPSVFLLNGSTAYPLCYGYSDYTMLEKNFDILLTKI